MHKKTPRLFFYACAAVGACVFLAAALPGALAQQTQSDAKTSAAQSSAAKTNGAKSAAANAAPSAAKNTAAATPASNPNRAFTEEEQSIIQSIRISTNRDLALWLSSLGLGIDGGRAAHEAKLLEYYGLPADALRRRAAAAKPKQLDTPEDPAEPAPAAAAEATAESPAAAEASPESASQTAAENATENATENAAENPEEAAGENASENASGNAGETPPQITTEVVEAPVAAGETNEISIKNADKAQYFTYEKVNENVFILSGSVQITINQPAKKRIYRILSDRLIYNESLRTGSAVGNVRFQMFEYAGQAPDTFEGEATEEFTGEVVSFDIDAFNSDVVHGISRIDKEVTYGKDRKEKETLAFRIFTPHLSKSPQDIITLSDASLTSSVVNPPLYRIRVRKMWVLGSGEWAISRATVFVGDIPIIWLPFFVNPGDKFFFYPAIGYRLRGGGYINTTTFFIGAPDKSENTQFLDIFDIDQTKDSGKQKIIKGLYLREPEPGDVVRTYPPQWGLKLMLDYYTTVGGYTAIEGDFPNVWNFSKLSFKAGLGFSRTVYTLNNLYFNNYPAPDGTLQHNFDQGVFYNMRAPVRYNFLFDAALGFGDIYTTSLIYEQYSDSFLKRDYFQRLFDFDWQQILDPNKGITDLNARPSQISSYLWQWENNVDIPIEKLLGNYMSNLSINNFRTQMNWSRKNMAAQYLPYAYANRLLGSSVDQQIEGTFFYPSQIDLPSYQIKASGTLFAYDSTNPDFSNGMENTIFFEKKKSSEESSAESGAETNADAAVNSAAAEGDTQTAAAQPPIGTLPSVGISEDLSSPKTVSVRGGVVSTAPRGVAVPDDALIDPTVYDFNWKKVTLSYTYDITHFLEERLYVDDTKWLRPEDITFLASDFIKYGNLTTDNRFLLAQNLSVFGGVLTYMWDITLLLKNQTLNNDGALSDTERGQRVATAVKYGQEDITNKHAVTVYPLKMYPIFAQSSVGYIADFFIARDLFGSKKPMASFIPEDDAWWTAHTLKSNYTVTYAGVTNEVAFAVELPPRAEAYTPSYSLKVDTFLTFTLQSKIFKNKRADTIFLYDPLGAALSLNFFENNLQFSQNVNYNYENFYVKDTKSTLKAWWFTLDFTSVYDQEQRFNADSFSFTRTGEKQLRPEKLTASFDYEVSNLWFWKNRINFVIKVNASYAHAFLTFTDTNLSLAYTFEFNIYKALKLSFSVGTKNDLMFLYYDEYASQAGVTARNFWQDVLDGFNFFDSNALKRTPFKLSKLSLGIMQDFGGWVLSVTYSGEPTQSTSNGRILFEWKNVLEVGVAWKPIADIKSSFYYRDDKLSLDEEKKKL